MAAPKTPSFGFIKRHHWALAALLTAGLVAAVLRYRRPNVTALMERGLEAAIKAGTGRLYDVTLGSFTVDRRSGSVSVAGLSLEPIGAEFERAGLRRELIWFRAERLAFEGVDAERLIRTREFKAALLRIESPQLKVHLTGRHPKGEAQPQVAQLSRYLYGLPFLATIDSIELRNGKLSFLQDSSQGSKGLQFAASGLDVTIVNANDDRTVASKTRADIRLKDYVGNGPLHSVGMKEFHLVWPAGVATIAGLYVRPDSAAFARLPLPPDQIAFSTDTLQLRGIRLAVPPAETRLQADLVRLVRPSLRVFHDQTIVRPPSYRLRALPQEALQDLPAVVALDSVVVIGGGITYAERSGQTREVGSVTFEALDIQARNLTNDSAWLARDSVGTITAGASLMGQGRLRADFTIPLVDTSGAYGFAAVMGPMAATALNPVTVPLASFELRSGMIDGLRLDVRGNNQTYVGSMELRFHALDAGAVDPDQPVRSGGKKGLAGFLSDRLFNQARNPPAGRELQIGDIYWPRDPSRSIFYNWWKSVLTGIESSALRSATARGL